MSSHSERALLDRASRDYNDLLRAVDHPLGAASVRTDFGQLTMQSASLNATVNFIVGDANIKLESCPNRTRLQLLVQAGLIRRLLRLIIDTIPCILASDYPGGIALMEAEADPISHVVSQGLSLSAV